MEFSRYFLVLFGVALLNALLFLLYVHNGYTVFFLVTLHGHGSGTPENGNLAKELLEIDQSKAMDGRIGGEQAVPTSLPASAPLLSTQEGRELNRQVSAGVGYLLAMVYAEQISSATRHYQSLVNLAAKWGMKSVEPFITGSRLYGTQCLYGSLTNQSFYHYSRFYDIMQVDRELSQCLVGPNTSVISSRTSFLHDSYRDVVVVHFVRKKPHIIASNCGNIHSNKPYLQEFRTQEKGTIDCTRIAAREGMKAAVELTLNKELDRNEMSDVARFRVSRIICVDATKAVSLAELKEFIQSGGDENNRESVLFVYWQGQRTAESFTGGRLVSRCSVLKIKHSTEVAKSVSMFISSLELKQPFLSLHIRSERILISNSLHDGYWACCLKRLHSLISNITRKYQLQDVLMIRDYGQYGTDSCHYGNHIKPHQYCRMLSDRMMEEIKQWGISYSAFEPVKFKTVDNSGFVSLVEADALLRGSVLLTVGGGGYQGLLMGRFIDQASSAGYSQAYHICPSYMAKEKLHSLLPGSSCEDLLP